jgi:hypothetical protein
MTQVVQVSMTLPKQSTPVVRNQREVAVAQSAAVTQSGCCVQVFGKCLLELPIC